MLYRLRLLEIAEYLFITASAVGIFATSIFNKPIIYALAFVFISVLLNLVNRRKLATQTKAIQIDTSGKVDEYKNSISEMILQLNNSINSFKSTAEALENYQEDGNIQSLIETIKNLSKRLDIHEQTIKLLQTELDLISQQFKKRPELQQINDLTSVIIDLQQFINKLPEWSDLRQRQFQNLEEKVNNALHQLSQNLGDFPNQVDFKEERKEADK
ncbi:MAG: hypothetical protein WBA93_31185 [Microcoleaceae cyanobacterium]